MYVWLESEPLALREYELRPGLYFYINDHQGTPQQLITADGTTVWQAAYLPFGRIQVQLGTVQKTCAFPASTLMPRLASTTTGTGTTIRTLDATSHPTTIDLDGGLNLYAYVENDPVNLIDPEGLFVLPIMLTPDSQLSP